MQMLGTETPHQMATAVDLNLGPFLSKLYLDLIQWLKSIRLCT